MVNLIRYTKAHVAYVAGQAANSYYEPLFTQNCLVG